jgi:hypothetical protein
MNHSSVLIDASSDYPRLDQVLHIAYFVPVNWGGQDKVSRSVVDFQHGRQPQADQWVRLAEMLLQPAPCDLIVRALSSKESSAGGEAPLDVLCARLAQKLNAPYAPERLWKTRRTLAVKNAGGLSARRKALLGAYEFNGHDLPPNTRVLVVDDLITTGATAQTIASTIRKELPDAEVRLFALARTNPHLVRLHLEDSAFEMAEEAPPVVEMNPHIDERYFSRSVAPEIVMPRERKLPPASPAALPQPPVRPAAAGPPAAEPVLPGTVIEGPPPLVEIPPEFGLDAPPRTAATTPVGGVAGKGRSFPRLDFSRLLARVPVASIRRAAIALRSPMVIGLGVGALIFVGVFLANQFLSTEVEVSRIPPPEKFTPPQPKEEPPPPPQEAPKKRPPIPRGTINVPSIRLRSEPSLDAEVLTAEVRMGDRVQILKKVPAEAGPDWLQIRTAQGISGWLFTSVVTPDSLQSPR